ncbi:MAG: MscL family protein [candidate division KSB1 bacterium]|nr:MscL family protein [candidate division KSB1 bacterium]
MLKEFYEFIKKYGVIGLAIAVIIGTKVTALVTSIVNDIVMPIIGVVLPAGGWENWVLKIGKLHLGLGHFLAALIDFVIVAFLVFLFAKFVLKETEVAKK